MADPNFTFTCGDEVKHKITGFAGTVIARTQWLNGCRRYTIQSKGLKDGKTIDPEVFDEGELLMVKAQKLPGPAAAKPPGGPQRGERQTTSRR